MALGSSSDNSGSVVTTSECCIVSARLLLPCPAASNRPVRFAVRSLDAHALADSDDPLSRSDHAGRYVCASLILTRCTRTGNGLLPALWHGSGATTQNSLFVDLLVGFDRRFTSF